jgi:hypothetical protein
MTMPQSESTPADQAALTIPPRQETPRLENNLPLERRLSLGEATQRWSELANKQAATVAGWGKLQWHDPPTDERILMMNYATTW